MLQIVIIAWSQREGGVQQHAAPSFTLKSNHCMNIYNLHRMLQKEPSFGTFKLRTERDEYNVCSFYSGFGEGGYGGNYGRHVIGVSERVIALFLPKKAVASQYDQVLMYLASRILIREDGMEARTDKIVKFINQSRLEDDPDRLFNAVEDGLDAALGLNAEDQAVANQHLVKGYRYYVLELQEQIKELKTNPAQSAMLQDNEALKNKEVEVARLREMIDQVNQQLSINQAVGSQQNEMIDQLKADYIKIFGTLTDQIMALESELNAIKESSMQLVQDLNGAYADRLAYIQHLEQEIQNLKASQ
jgi:hypothetical protein